MAFLFTLVYICVMQLFFSFIIPVYNRPNEILELLESFLIQESPIEYEIVIVEDGSTITSKQVVDNFKSQLNISYYYKQNSGPGDSRNLGMQKAKGNYFIILDSDCILPKDYVIEVEKNLKAKYVDCFGGPDAAHHSFTNLQKAINFSMTSFITTGGIRGNKNSVNKFQPRSFNMGISKKAFNATQGFGRIHPGEDPDLSIRLWNLGFDTAFFETVYVYHKRRISWSKFYTQVKKFGMVRPILNTWHPSTKKNNLLVSYCICFGFYTFCFSCFFLFNATNISYIRVLYFGFYCSFNRNKKYYRCFSIFNSYNNTVFWLWYWFFKIYIFCWYFKTQPREAISKIIF